MAKPEKRHAQLNRNFLNFPLARDPRVKSEWFWSHNQRHWWRYLPGDDRIVLILPAEIDDALKRHPNGFDLSLLFLLLSKAQIQKSTALHAKSPGAILKEMGVSGSSHDWQSLSNAIDLLSNITIEIEHWRGNGDYITKTLPPPIKLFKRQDDGLAFELSDDWRQLCEQGYFARVPLPLPTSAATQNLILWLFTARLEDEPTLNNSETSHDFIPVRTTISKTKRQLCKIIGVSHSTRNQILHRAIDSAAEWFFKHEGYLMKVEFGNSICFKIKMPRLPKQKVTKKPTKPTIARERLEQTKPVKRSVVEQVPASKWTWPEAGVAHDEFGRRIQLYRAPDGREVDRDEMKQMLREAG